MAQCSADTSYQYGLIILGNSGVGKSFIANIFVGRDVFLHEFNARSVTHDTEYVETDIGGCKLAVFNIPGLIEADQTRIDLNKREIDKAFSQRPNSVIIYVFGQQNGRIREEDIVAFKAINAAYPFRPQSLVLVVNGLPKSRPRTYEGTTLVLLQQLLAGVEVNTSNVCFLDYIDVNHRIEKQRFKEQLLKVVVEFTPTMHEKKQEIETFADQLNKSKKEIQEQRTEFETQLAKYTKQIEDNQQILNQTIATHRTETQSLQRALERQERKFDEERRKHENQLRQLREQTKRARFNYEQFNNNNRATQQELQAAKRAYESLQASYNKLAAKPLRQPASATKRHSSCVIS